MKPISFRFTIVFKMVCVVCLALLAVLGVKLSANATEEASVGDTNVGQTPAIEEILRLRTCGATLRMTCGDGLGATLRMTCGEQASTQADAQRIAMYRLYNKWTGEHFYTSDKAEKEKLVKGGWNDEGTGWYAPSTSSTPVYRLYNSYALGGEHHYTKSKEEVNKLVKAGWSDEGTGWYSVEETDSEKVPVYRQYNPNAFSCNHNYTIDASEKDNVIKAGWNDEGIGWYGYSSNTAAIDFSKITVTTVAKTYNGKAQTQTITSNAYKLNTDYTVTYSNNTNAGTATITIKGKGSFTGTKTYKFTINKATPVCIAPTDLVGKLGNTLSTVDLSYTIVSGNTSGKFAWSNGTQTMSEAGEKEFIATFTPTDTKNYLSVNNILIKVEVGNYEGYWLGTKNAGEEYISEAYFAKNDKNYVSGDDISADMEVLHDSSNSNYESVKAKWDKYYSEDTVRLYVRYKGGENEQSYNDGATSTLNKYVEFRILEVSGASGHKLHRGTTSDGSAVTFMATHVLPTAYQMNASNTNVGGWSSSQLYKELNKVSGSAGEIYSKFSTDFVSHVKAVTKEYNTGGSTSYQTEAPSEINCQFWVPSYTELVSATASDYGLSLPKYEGTQYAWCATNVTNAISSNACLEYTTRGGANPGSATFASIHWWERSPFVSSTIHFANVLALGDPSDSLNAKHRIGVVVAFCF